MYVCSNCGAASAKWQGKCFSCGEWNTLVSAPEPKKSAGKSKLGETTEATDLGSVKSLETETGRLPTSSAELARVLGGGLVPGSLTLLSGEPGIGKSTLALQIAGWNSASDSQVLYVTAEETLSQLANRAKRLQVPTDGLSAVALSDADAIIDTLQSEKSSLAIVDSVSMLSTDEATGSPGSVGQIRTVTEKLMQYAKASNTAIVLIGHVTKDGSISGPKALEHLVDTVLFLE
jgi:DNA repair protein RadA/Sms